MNYRQIETFRAVMLAGSASHAADLLRITQPAVSRSIAELEHALGFLLFDRIRGRLVPTPEAKLLMQEVQRSFIGLDRVRAEAARIRDLGCGSIRIASHSALGVALVPRAIKRFRDKNPDIVVTLQIHSTAMVRDVVANSVFDLGLVADEADLSGIEHREFSNTAGLCAMAAGHPLAEKAAIEPADLHERDFIALAPEDRARHRLDSVLEHHGVRPRIVVETPSSATVCALALEGAGIGFVSTFGCDGFAERGLVLRPFLPEVHFKSFLIFRPDALKTRLVKSFVTELMKARNPRS